MNLKDFYTVIPISTYNVVLIYLFCFLWGSVILLLLNFPIQAQSISFQVTKSLFVSLYGSSPTE